MKIYGGRFKVNSGRAKYYYYPESKDVVSTINSDVTLSGNDRLYAHFLVGRNINDNLWTKNKAVYGMLGGTAATHKWNWKDMRNLDAAFRILFSGTWTHSSLGSKPAGNNMSFADTFLVPSSNLTLNNVHLSLYSRDNGSNNSIDIGARIGSSPVLYLEMGVYTNAVGGTDIRMYSQSNINTTASNNGRGYFISTRISNSNVSVYKNGNKLAENLNLSTSGQPTNSIFLGGVHSGTGAISVNPSSLQISFSSIGDGLTEQEAAIMSNIISFAQGILNRKV